MKFLWTLEIDDCVWRFEGDSPMVEELRGLISLTAGRGFDVTQRL
jgi:hypothetical protein